MMSTLIRTAFLTVCLLSSAMAGAIELTSSLWQLEQNRDGEIEYVGRIDLSDTALTVINDGSGDRLELDECGYLCEPGAPVMPAYQIRIAVPAGMRATGLRVLEQESQPISGEFSVMHSQPENRVSADESDLILVERNTAVYNSDIPWPAVSARFLGYTDLAGQSMAVIEIYPLTYAPLSLSMTSISTLKLALTCESDEELGDYMPADASEKQKARYQNRLNEMVLNPAQVSLVSNELTRSPSSLEPGQYDLVVIYPAGWDPNFDEWIAWKTRCGIPATKVMNFWIYNDAGYTGTDEEKIRQFIVDAHQTWGTDYFLLGGDTNVIPCHWDVIDGDNIPNDTWYADYDDDWTLEVTVGRMPTRFVLEATAFLNKSMAYEKNPPLTDFCHSALLLGFDLDNDTDGEEAKEYIDDNYFNEQWAIGKVYDSHGGDHEDNSIDELDSGYNLINHIDHSDTSEMGLGSQHDWYLSQIQVNNLTNATERGILYSLGCFACNYEHYECIAETWAKADDGGGIAFVGNSSYGWYNPGLVNTISFLYDRYFFRSILAQNHTRLGDAFTDHKNDYYPSGGKYPYVWTELTLLGDPQLLIWTDDPVQIQVQYPTIVQTGSISDLVVQVIDGGGATFPGVDVCLYREGEIYSTIATGADGNATFDVSGVTDGEVLVTVTGLNALPHEGAILFVPYSSTDDSESDSVEPRVLSLETGRNPFVISTQLSYQIPADSAVELVVFDLAGRRVRTLVRAAVVTAGAYTASWDGNDEQGRPVAAGIYLYRLVTDQDRLTKRAVVIRK